MFKVANKRLLSAKHHSSPKRTNTFNGKRSRFKARFARRSYKVKVVGIICLLFVASGVAYEAFHEHVVSLPLISSAADRDKAKSEDLYTLEQAILSYYKHTDTGAYKPENKEPTNLEKLQVKGLKGKLSDYEYTNGNYHAQISGEQLLQYEICTTFETQTLTFPLEYDQDTSKAEGPISQKKILVGTRIYDGHRKGRQCFRNGYVNGPKQSGPYTTRILNQGEMAKPQVVVDPADFAQFEPTAWTYYSAQAPALGIQASRSELRKTCYREDAESNAPNKQAFYCQIDIDKSRTPFSDKQRALQLLDQFINTVKTQGNPDPRISEYGQNSSSYTKSVGAEIYGKRCYAQTEFNLGIKPPSFKREGLSYNLHCHTYMSEVPAGFTFTGS